MIPLVRLGPLTVPCPWAPSVQGGLSTMIPLVGLGPLTVPCPWAPSVQGGLSTMIPLVWAPHCSLPMGPERPGGPKHNDITGLGPSLFLAHGPRGCCYACVHVALVSSQVHQHLTANTACSVAMWYKRLADVWSVWDRFLSAGDYA